MHHGGTSASRAEQNNEVVIAGLRFEVACYRCLLSRFCSIFSSPSYPNTRLLRLYILNKASVQVPGLLAVRGVSGEGGSDPVYQHLDEWPVRYPLSYCFCEAQLCKRLTTFF